MLFLTQVMKFQNQFIYTIVFYFFLKKADVSKIMENQDKLY